MFTINFQSRVSVYQQIYDNVIRLVSIDILKPNDKLPAVRRLALDLGINPNTVAKAYSMLENDGYIYSVVGRGSFVSEKLNNTEADRLKKKKEIKEILREAHSIGVTADDIKAIMEEVFEEV